MRKFVSSMQRRLTVLAMAAGSVALVPVPCQGLSAAARQDTAGSVVGIPGANGRVVLTNMGGYASRPSVVSPSPLISAYEMSSAYELMSAYENLIEDISVRHGVDPRLTRAVIQVESAFDARAVSSKGARGLMQLIPATGERFGVNNFFDPADNIQGGVRFLRFLIDKFDGSADLVLAAYNAGENLVERLGRVPAFPETLDYVRKVRAVYEAMGGEWVQIREPAPAIVPRTRRPPEIYRTVDERGVLVFSSVGPSRQVTAHPETRGGDRE